MANIPKLEDYTVLLLCPLVVEQQAVYLMLDEVHDGVPERCIGQTVLYTLGRISSFNVAIAGYPAGEVGIGVSGSMASEALRDFPNLEVGLLIGIAAGIPSPKRDIRLGDVAVAIPNKDNPGVIGYDLTKVGDEVQLKQWQNSTHPLLRSAITAIQVRAGFPGNGFTRHLHVLGGSPAFKRPSPPASSSEWSPKMHQRDADDGPHVHYGTILSGNVVIKSKKRRDELRDKYDGIAIEMEAAGMMTRLPVAVIQGISNFADADFKKNDEWQPYAAITAAAYAKEMLIMLGPLRKESESASLSVISQRVEARWRLALPKQCRFVGRERELAKLEEWFDFHCQNPLQKSIITFWGLSGIGKSQLVWEFVKKQPDKHPNYDIFWIAGESKEAFEQSIIGVLRVADEPKATSLEADGNYQELRTGLINSFFTELKGPMRARWLLVIDGVSSDSVLQQSIRSYVNSLPCGSIILTARNKAVSEWDLHPSEVQVMEVQGLPERDAVKLLQLEIGHQLREGEEEDVLELASMLNGVPLSLRLATSVISRYPLTVASYVEKWKKRELDDEYLFIDRALLRSFQVSFEELEHTQPLATKLLILFGFLDHRDMWYDLCLNATNSEYPDWLRQIANQKRPQAYYMIMRNLSFIEVKNYSGKEYAYQIHPAIHEFSRWKAKGNEEEYVKCAVSLVAAMVPRSTDKDFLKIAQRLEPHADQCKMHMEHGRGPRALDLIELEKFGNLFRLLGRHEDACWLYERILNALREDDLSSEWTLELMANIENNLGLVYHAQRKYGIALQAFDQSCQRRLQLPAQDKDASMSTLYNKGRSLLMLGRLDEAQQDLLSAARYFSRAITGEDDENVEDDDDDLNLDLGSGERMPLYFRILNDLGETYLRHNNVDQAEQTFRQAFDGLKKYLHESHPATFAVRLNIGRICVERSQFASACKIFGYVIATYTEWWGRRHCETMRAVDELANSYLRQGKLKRLMGESGDIELRTAADLWTETLNFYQETYGTNSDIAILAGSRLRNLQSVVSFIEEDPYKMYYSSRA